MALQGEFGDTLTSVDGNVRFSLSSIPEGMSLFDYLSSKTPEERQALYDTLDAILASYPPALAGQNILYFVRREYAGLGVDLPRLSRSYIARSGFYMTLLALGSMAATLVVSFIASRISATLSLDLREALYEKVISFSSYEFRKFSTASLLTRTNSDVDNLQFAVIVLFRVVLYAPILGIGGIVKVLQTDTSMSFIIIGAIAFILFILVILYFTAIPKFLGMQALIDRLNLVSREMLTGLSVIRAFGAKEHEEARFDKANRALYKNGLYVGRAIAFIIPLVSLIMNMLSVLIVLYGTRDISRGLLQVGDMIAFIQYATQIITAFLMIAAVYILLPKATISVKRINEVLDTEVEITDPEEPLDQHKKDLGLVEFQNVYFSYPDSHENVLTDITFTARPGETTAIIGSTGSGKSTLLSMIPRLFDAVRGRVLVGGVDVKKLPLKKLRDQIGFVPQKGRLFRGTIASNIKFMRPGISEEEMKRSAAVAQAAEFIEEKKFGYASEISEGGMNVSGGQRQRLSIARAIAKNPDILLFDDSFSALDFQTEAALRDELQKKIAGKTIILVAQRINTVLSADQIIVLENGRIAGAGKHRELLKNCSVYQQIALSQLTAEELKA